MQSTNQQSDNVNLRLSDITKRISSKSTSVMIATRFLASISLSQSRPSKPFVKKRGVHDAPPK
jgi:hypothetical protein